MIGSVAAAVASGSLVGFTLGLIGGGGSILATPLLLYAVGIAQPHVAIGTSALAVAINAFANLIGHARAGNVRWLGAIVFALVGTAGAVGGSGSRQKHRRKSAALSVRPGHGRCGHGDATAAEAEPSRPPAADLRTCLLTGLIALAAGDEEPIHGY